MCHLVLFIGATQHSHPLSYKCLRGRFIVRHTRILISLYTNKAWMSYWPHFLDDWPSTKNDSAQDKSHSFCHVKCKITLLWCDLFFANTKQRG